MARSIKEAEGSPAQPIPEETITLRAMTKAHEAGAMGNWNWLEDYFGELLNEATGPEPVLVPRTQLTLLREFQYGLDFLRTKKISMGAIDTSDDDMARPTDTIKSSFDIKGLISGLKLTENSGVGQEFLERPGSLDWAMWCRLGYALAGKPGSIPPVDRVFKQYLSAHYKKT
jgi:hypothetical protein